MKINRLTILILLPLLAALACNYPLAVPASMEQEAAPVDWQTATPAPFLLPTENLPLTPLADGVVEPTPDPSLPIILPTLPASAPPPTAPILYYTQAGDTLPALAVRFGVNADEITSPDPIAPQAVINPNQLLIIPNRLEATTPSQRILPDSEIVYSPSAIDFNIEEYVREAGGYLSTYSEFLGTTGVTTGAEIVERVALENSINPRLLLALLEYQGHWIYGQANELNLSQKDYPLGHVDAKTEGLYRQLAWAVNQLSIGYYGWREGLLSELVFSDGSAARLAPELNAGTVSLQYYLAGLHDPETWLLSVNPDGGFPALYTEMFGNPWVRAQAVEPLYPPNLEQPLLILPFIRDQVWAYTGGPHGAWERDGARAALDFAPGSTEPGCVKSNKMVLASASGLVTRSGNGVVMIDLDGDGHEQTGWGLMYLHVSTNGGGNPAPEGTWVEAGDFIGYPSCEGGAATGTHIHIARKYNGEWIPADGPMPFFIGGWVAQAGWKPYEGSLIRGQRTIQANPLGTFDTRIIREQDDP